MKLQFRAGHGLDHIAIGIFAAVDRYLTGAFNADSALAGVIQHDLRLLYIAVDIRDGEVDLLPRVGAVRLELDVLNTLDVGITYFHIIRKGQLRASGIARSAALQYWHIQICIFRLSWILCGNNRHDKIIILVIVPTRNRRFSESIR